MAEDSVLQPLVKLKVRYFFTDIEASSVKKASTSGSKKFLVMVTEVIAGFFYSVLKTDFCSIKREKILQNHIVPGKYICNRC